MGVATELLKVRKSLVQPVKDASNPQFRSSYVTFDAVVKAVDDAIKTSKAELVWAQEVKGGQLFTVLLTDDEMYKQISNFYAFNNLNDVRRTLGDLYWQQFTGEDKTVIKLALQDLRAEFDDAIKGLEDD